MNTTETTRPQKLIPLQKILDARIRILGGESESSVAKDLKISVSTLQDRMERLDEIEASSLPALTVDQRIINETISDHLRPIKLELSTNALEIVRKADKLIKERLDREGDSIGVKDLVKTADSFEGRLARIVPIEELPEAGPVDQQKRRTVINNFVHQNIINQHINKLEKDRLAVNDVGIDNKPIDVVPTPLTTP